MENTTNKRNGRQTVQFTLRRRLHGLRLIPQAKLRGLNVHSVYAQNLMDFKGQTGAGNRELLTF